MIYKFKKHRFFNQKSSPFPTYTHIFWGEEKTNAQYCFLTFKMFPLSGHVEYLIYKPFFIFLWILLTMYPNKFSELQPEL